MAVVFLGAMAFLADQVSRAKQPDRPSKYSFVLSGIENLIHVDAPWAGVGGAAGGPPPGWFDRFWTRVRG